MPLNTDVIIAELKRRNKSQAWLAREARMPAPNVSRILAGKDVSLSTAERIAAVLGKKLTAILKS